EGLPRRGGDQAGFHQIRRRLPPDPPVDERPDTAAAAAVDRRGGAGHGLARNRLLAKIAAGRDKPRGFAVIGSEAAKLLATEPVRLLPGVGPALAKRLEGMGITLLGHLQGQGERDAMRKL